MPSAAPVLRTRLVEPEAEQADEDGQQDAAALRRAAGRSRTRRAARSRCRRRRAGSRPSAASRPARATPNSAVADHQDGDLGRHHLHPLRHPEQQRHERAARPLGADPGGADEEGEHGRGRAAKPSAPPSLASAKSNGALADEVLDPEVRGRQRRAGVTLGSGRGELPGSSRHCCRHISPGRRRSARSAACARGAVGVGRARRSWVSAMTIGDEPAQDAQAEQRPG